MSQKIIIDSEHNKKFHGRKFGPFKTQKGANSFLKRCGWSDEKATGEKGLWYAQIGRYEGINARVGFAISNEVCELENPNLIPEGKFYLPSN
ncbi:MAG: hypothetical protein WCT19_01880 [Candidatus Paceibacterota bacterium]